MKARNSAKPRCSARASVSLRMPTPKVKGSGEAYQSWNSAQASDTAKITVAATPVGLRAPVSASATSCCSASGAFSMSVAMRVLSEERASRGFARIASQLAVYLIQPFSL